MSSGEEHRILTKAKLSEMIKASEKAKTVELTYYRTMPGAEKGDNFSGEVVACDVKAKIDGGPVKEFHWMVKVPPEDKSKMPLLRDMEMERKEIEMYEVILPAWRKMVAEKDLADDVIVNCPEAPYTEFHEDPDKGSVIAMENLKHKGYRDAIDKRQGLNPDHVYLALEQIANFHALSYIYFKNYPGGTKEALEKHKILARDHFLSEPGEMTKQFFKAFKPHSDQCFIDVAEVSQEDGQGLLDAFKKYMSKKDLFELAAEKFSVDPDGFNVLCHGDAWFNNMLFQYEKNEKGEETKPKTLALVDLAIGRWGSPVVDLSYFLLLSTTPQLRKTHLERFLGHYHDCFIRCLHKMGEDPTVYPYRQLIKDFNSRVEGGFILSFWLLPAVILPKEDALGQEEISYDPENMEESMNLFREKMKAAWTKNPMAKKFFGGNLLEMVERGFMEM